MFRYLFPSDWNALSLSLSVPYLARSTLRAAWSGCRVCVEANRRNILQSRARCWKACWIFQWPAVLSCLPVCFLFLPRFRLKTTLVPLPRLCRATHRRSFSFKGELKEEQGWKAHSNGGTCLFCSLLETFAKGQDRRQLDISLEFPAGLEVFVHETLSVKRTERHPGEFERGESSPSVIRGSVLWVPLVGCTDSLWIKTWEKGTAGLPVPHLDLGLCPRWLGDSEVRRVRRAVGRQTQSWHLSGDHVPAGKTSGKSCSPMFLLLGDKWPDEAFGWSRDVFVDFNLHVRDRSHTQLYPGALRSQLIESCVGGIKHCVVCSFV